MIRAGILGILEKISFERLLRRLAVNEPTCSTDERRALPVVGAVCHPYQRSLLHSFDQPSKVLLVPQQYVPHPRASPGSKEIPEI